MITATWNGDSIDIPETVAAPVYPYPINTFPKPIPGSPVIEDYANQPFVVSDFAQGVWNRSATDNGAWGLLGNNAVGMFNAKLSMKAMSSTKGGLVNALPSGTSCNYQMFRLGIGASPNILRPSYFTGRIDGTPQGHQYTLMQSYQTDKSIFGPFVLKGGVGKPGGVPPYETNAWGSYNDTNPTWTDFEIDGTDATGTPVTASGIGLGPHDKGGTYSFTRGYIHDLAHGHGITHYSITNATINMVDMHFKNVPYSGANFEKCNGSVITMTRPNFDNCVVDIIADSDTGFATINIVDPVLTTAHPKVIVCVHAKYNYPGPDVSPNKQLDAATNNHVTVNVGGVSRPDLIDWRTSYTPRTP